jgi:DNA-binding NarL/FixJ family response regulator
VASSAGLSAADPLVGREKELAFLDEVVSSIERGARFVVLRGPAGIGKTALWRAAVRRHREAGHRVLATRPAEEELAGPMVGLVDLFGDTEADPGALAADLDRFQRGRAVLATLRHLAAGAPLVVAIDDVQWLDPVSAAALRYGLRRLDGDPVAVLATERSDPADLADDRTIPAGRREEIMLGPLSLAGVRAAVSTIVDRLPRPVLARIHELAQGNPMFAIELARATGGSADPLTAAATPTLRDLLSSRIGGVSADVLDMLRVVAASGPSHREAIARNAAVDDPAPLVDAAAARSILVVGHDQVVRFTHPILASVVLVGIDPIERQALHARLAAAATDPDTRARHLALSCAEPDAGAAAELEDAARRASRRGASSLAADLAAHSIRVTPADDLPARVRRTFLAILHRAAAGDRAGALAQSEELLARLPAGPVRAEAITLRVGMDFAHGDQFLAQALAEAGDDELLRGRIIDLQGWMAAIYRGEPRRAVELGEAALAIARRRGDATLEMLAASSLATAAVMIGNPRPELMEWALELARTHRGPLLGRWPQALHGRVALWCGDLAEARATLEALHDAFVLSGIEFQRPYRMLDLAELELAAGDVARAWELAADGIEAAADAGNEQAVAWLSYPAGLASAHLGHPERAREAAATLAGRAGEAHGQRRLAMAHEVRGLAALTEGQPARAVAELAPGLAVVRNVGLRLPSAVPVLPDSIEATALAGDVQACAALAAELTRDAEAVGQPWVDAAAVRGRGLAALAAGDAGAAGLLDEAAIRFEELGYMLDAARARLLHGRALRRTGHRRASAEVLGDARQRFAAMAAVPWQALAEAELARVAPRRTTADLTPTEARIAELVCEGRRNREIAGELFVSVATVEAHLTRIYRKLQVRSRTELVQLLR